jgi:hypothetical protein
VDSDNCINVSIPLKLDIKLENALNNGTIDYRHLILRKGKLESTYHILLKLIAYIYFLNRDIDLIIEPTFRYRRYKPDLIAFKEPEIPHEIHPDVYLWVECKKVKISKLKKIGRYLPSSEIYWFHTYSTLLKIVKTKKVVLPTNIHLIGVETETKNRLHLENSLLKQQIIWKIIKITNKRLVISSRNFTSTIHYHPILYSSPNKRREKGI